MRNDYESTPQLPLIAPLPRVDLPIALVVHTGIEAADEVHLQLRIDRDARAVKRPFSHGHFEA